MTKGVSELTYTVFWGVNLENADERRSEIITTGEIPGKFISLERNGYLTAYNNRAPEMKNFPQDIRLKIGQNYEIKIAVTDPEDDQIVEKQVFIDGEET